MDVQTSVLKQSVAPKCPASQKKGDVLWNFGVYMNVDLTRDLILLKSNLRNLLSMVRISGPRKAAAILSDILTKSADARKMALSMKHVEYGGELLNQLMSSSSKMEKIHEKLNDMVTRNVLDDSKYLKLCDLANNEIKWFDKAKARL